MVRSVIVIHLCNLVLPVLVPDDRFKWLCAHFKPKSEVPANLTVYDIAGLVPGAHKGEGLGNAFLSHIQSVDGIYHVVGTTF